MASKAATEPVRHAGGDEGEMIEKVTYKGFIHCDHPTRLPNEYTIEGIHAIFTNKKLMKQAQEENPLAGRGYKKAVMMLASLDGFRLDMFSKDSEGSLLHSPVDKIVVANAIDSYVYVVVRRGRGEGKFTCHCMQGSSKGKGKQAQNIEHYLNRTQQAYAASLNGADPDSAGTGYKWLTLGAEKVPQKRGRASIHNDDHAAALRKASIVFEQEEAEEAAAGGGAGVPRAPSQLEDYLGGEEDGGALRADEMAQVTAMLHGGGDEPAAGGLESMPWYHGSAERVVAERRLMWQAEPGVFLIRESSDKAGYSLSLVNVDRKVRHFKILSQPGDRWALHGHENAYASVAALVQHYGAHDITAEGDRCLEPCKEV